MLENQIIQETKPSTLLIIPCYNEEATIGSLILKAKQYVSKVLVIDDGSCDDTIRIARDAGAEVISHGINNGKSAAIKSGFSYALNEGYDYVVTIDGDGQHNPHEIPYLLSNMITNGHDISIGYRYGDKTEMPLWRKFGKRVLDYSTGFGTGGFITDSQCGFRAFNRRAIETITPGLNGNDFSIESEQLIKAHEHGLSVVNTHISCKYDNLDTSTKNPGTHGFSVLSYIIWLIAQKHPLIFIGVPGFVLINIGLFFSIQTLQYYNRTHVFLTSYAILVSILLIIGTLAMFIGLTLNVLPKMLKNSR